MNKSFPTRTTQLQPYTHLAQVYDELMGDRYIHIWWKAFTRFFRSGRFSYRSFVDIAGGTGEAARRLAGRGKKAFILDQSEAMLAIAQKKMRNATCLQQKMQSMKLPHPVDLAVCAYGGIHYLSSQLLLETFFKKVHQALNVNGWFCFDMYTEHYLKKLCRDGRQILATSDTTCLWDFSWNAQPKGVDILIQGFTGLHGAWSNHWVEKHEHNVFDQKQIINALKKAKFTKIESFNMKNMKKTNKKDDFYIFFCQKE